MWGGPGFDSWRKTLKITHCLCLSQSFWVWESSTLNPLHTNTYTSIRTCWRLCVVTHSEEMQGLWLGQIKCVGDSRGLSVMCVCAFSFYGDVLFVIVVCSGVEQALNSEQVNGTFIGLSTISWPLKFLSLLYSLLCLSVALFIFPTGKCSFTKLQIIPFSNNTSRVSLTDKNTNHIPQVVDLQFPYNGKIHKWPQLLY